MVWDFAFSPLTSASNFELLSHITKIAEKYFFFWDSEARHHPTGISPRQNKKARGHHTHGPSIHAENRSNQAKLASANDQLTSLSRKVSTNLGRMLR